MNKQEQMIYLLGYIKASIEYLGGQVQVKQSDELFDMLADLEANINCEMKKIFE